MAGPTTTALPANTWTKVLSNIVAGKVNKISGNLIVHTYRTAGATAPSNGTSKNLKTTTISFASATKKILDSASGFTFASGDFIRIIGSQSNDGIYSVSTAAAGELVVNETLADESAGANVGLYYVSEGVEAFRDGEPEFFSSNVAVDVYMMSVGIAGSVRVDTHLMQG